MSGNRFKCYAFLLCFSLVVWGQTAWGQSETPAPQAGALDAIVVTSSSRAELVRDVTSNITVITAEDIAKTAGSVSLANILEKNGFMLYDSGSSASLYIRGLGNSSMTAEIDSQVLILLNGHRVGSPDLSIHFPANIERIEIIRGPAALQYGAAVAGVVNLITKKAQDGVFNTNLQLGGGSANFLDQSFSFAGATNGLDVSFGMYRSSRGDLLVSGGERWNKTSYNYKLGFDLEAGYTFLENHRIGVNFYYSNLKGVNLPSGGYLDTLGTSSLNYSSNDIYLHNTTFTYAGATPDKVFNWSAAYTFGEVDNLGTYYTDASYPNVDNTYRMHVKMDEFKAQLTFDKQIIALTGGFDYLNYIYSTEYLAFPPATVTEIVTKDLAFYLLAKAKLLNDRLIISAAGRYDVYDSDVQGVNYSKTNTVFSPSIGVAFMPADFIKLRANYSEGVRMPNPSYILGIPGQINPNHDLDIERSKSFEIGFDLSYDYIDASLTYFYTNVINKIVSTGYLPTFYNLDKKATLAGFEASFRFDIGQMLERDFTLAPYMSLTWLTTRKHGQDTAVIPQAPKTLPYVPTFMATYGIDFEHPGIGLSANLNFSYIGYRWTQDYSWMAQAAKGGNWYNHGGDTVVDISVKQRLWDTGDKGQFYAKASVTNLFDTNYSYTYDYPMPGRSFYLGLGYEY